MRLLFYINTINHGGAERVIKLYNDKDLLIKFSKKSKEMAKKCSYDTVISNWDEVILG